MNANKKILLKGMTIEELKTWCQSYDLPVFRAQQIYEWMYSHGIDDISEMTNLSQQCRNIISDNCNINTLEITSQVSSKNNKTIKYVFSTKDGQYIESVSMIGKDGRHTVCISSQSGCSLACDFCATAKMGLMKNLSTGEILDQLIIIRKLSRKRIDNVVYMGMGEPFLNYDNVIKSANIINSKKGFNISTNKITISTVGIVPKILKFIKEKNKFGLAISLNAPNDSIRDYLMPINKKWPIADLVAANKEYVKQYKRNKITFEYVMIDNINSSIDDAIELSKILNIEKCKINIIPYNEIDGKYKRPSNEKIDNFLATLSLYNKNFQILVRWSNGIDIDAGCGQLAVKQ